MTAQIPTRCQSHVSSGSSFLAHQCTNTAIGVDHKGDAYCGVHAPRHLRKETAVQRRQREANAVNDQRRVEGLSLLDALGVSGKVNYRYINSQAPAVCRELLISFDEAQKLIDRLASTQPLKAHRDELATVGVWRTIDTAPKDGTLLVGFSVQFGVGYLGFARWQRYDDGSDSWSGGGTSLDGKGWTSPLNPTHWMPLPAPPTSGGDR